MSRKIPRSSENDYSMDIVQQRQAFIETTTGASLDHTRKNEWVDAHEKPGRKR